MKLRLPTLLLTSLVWLILLASPVWAQKKPLGAVATQHPLATQTAVKILKKGGNAMDAAIAAALTLAVVEPYNSGLGAGGLALLWDGVKKKAAGLDFRETAPQLATADLFSKNGVPPDASKNGPLAIAVPGEVLGLGVLHLQWGKLKWSELFTDAIHLAEDGFIADEGLLQRVREKRDCLMRDYHTYKIYRPILRPKTDLHPTMYPEVPPEPSPGAEPKEEPILFTQPDLAKTLKHLRDHGAEDFYTGTLAFQWVANLKGKGALIRMADLQAYQAMERTPLSSQFPWGRVWGFPLPSSGGISVLRGLNTLEALEKETGARLPWIHWMIQVFGQVFETRNQEMGDSDFVKEQPVRKWISKNFARSQAKKILQVPPPVSKTKSPPKPAPADEDLPKTNGQTTHLSVMDAQGNAVSMTLTQNLPFGSCVTAGETGILMNNQMDDFSTRPGKPNAFGLVQSQNNAIEPGKRPLSSMSPTLVTRDKRVILAIGSPGGPRIITTILQVLYRHFFLGDDLHKAIARTRFHYQDNPNQILVERPFPKSWNQAFPPLRIPIHLESPWGNVEAVAFDPETGKFSGESDPRGQGRAEVVTR